MAQFPPVTIKSGDNHWASACLYTTHAIAQQIFIHYFVDAGDPDHQPRIYKFIDPCTNKHHVYVGCKIVGNGEESW